jgi:hypothetical protein
MTGIPHADLGWQLFNNSSMVRANICKRPSGPVPPEIGAACCRSARFPYRHFPVSTSVI